MKDLTNGSIAKNILQMAVPIMAGMFFQTLYFLIDLYFVSGLGDAAIAPDTLARRAATCAAMFNRAGDERVIRLHPEDLALVHDRLPDAWHCEPDPQLERGAIRIECGTGGVEDGPAQWRAALTDALRTW